MRSTRAPRARDRSDGAEREWDSGAGRAVRVRGPGGASPVGILGEDLAELGLPGRQHAPEVRPAEPALAPHPVRGHQPGEPPARRHEPPAAARRTAPAGRRTSRRARRARLGLVGRMSSSLTSARPGSCTASRMACGDVLGTEDPLGVGCEHRLIAEHPGVHRSGADGDDPDAFLPDLEHQRAAEAEHGVLGCRVGRPADEAVPPGQAGHVDDGAPRAAAAWPAGRRG